MEAWYLLCYQPGKGNLYKAQLSLDRKNINFFCPMLRTYRERKDCNSFRMSVEPLFNGYIFVAFDPEVIHPAKIETECPGVSKFVRYGNEIKSLSPHVIESLMDLPFCTDELDRYRFTSSPAKTRPKRPPKKTRRRMNNPQKVQNSLYSKIREIVEIDEEPLRTAMFVAFAESLAEQRRTVNGYN